jgi:hypothetical protein
MARQEVFYIGRVVKIGFDQDQLIEAILSPKVLHESKYVWSIVNSKAFEIDGLRFIYGKLNKSIPTGIVPVLSEDLNEEIEKEEPRLIIDSSEFLYIPQYSGITFRSISNTIEPKLFKKKFCRIVEDTIGPLLLECDIKLIDDIRSFYQKISQIDRFTYIKTKVNPPNPLFGRFWKSLKEYLIDRNADELSLVEKSNEKKLNTKIIELMKILLSENEEALNNYIEKNDISIVDASILMSLDGYGDGRIDGYKGKEYVFIKTHEKALNFTIHKEHSIDDIFQKANSIFLRINDERYMEH